MDNKRLRRNTPEEIVDISPAKMRQPTVSKPAASDSCGSPGAAFADAQKEANVLFSQFSQVLSESAAVDNSQMRELTDIVTEARGLEENLRAKKDHLKRTLTLISDKLQG